MSASTKTRKRRGSAAPKPKERALDEATRMAKALSHPLRTRILVRLNEKVASPNELAEELGAPLGNVSYHVRTLLDLNFVELVKTEPRRGAVEHYYRAMQRAWGDQEVWELLPPRARRGFAVEWLREALGDVSAAIEEGGLENRADVELSFTRLNLDERAWRKLSKRVQGLVEYALSLQAESAGRLQAEGGDGEITTGLILAQYEAAEKKPARTQKRRS